MHFKKIEKLGVLFLILQLCIICLLWNKKSNTKCKTMLPITREFNYTNLLVDNDKKQIIFCFQFLHELDLLHIKLKLLSHIVTLFVICESSYDDRGNKKELIFKNHMNETRFKPFLNKIQHYVDFYIPTQQGTELGWKMNQRMRDSIGEKIIYQLSEKYPDSIVITGDADEIPSVESLQWLVNNCCKPKITYEFASTMPAFMYGFNWLTTKSGYAMLTARTMQDEKEFWQLKFSGLKQNQIIMPLPFYPSGWHCSYCFTSDLCVNKLKHANLADGPPFLGLYEWSVEIFDALRACGVAPQGNTLFKRTDFDDVVLPEWDQNVYKYMFNMQFCSKHMLALIEMHKNNRY